MWRFAVDDYSHSIFEKPDYEQLAKLQRAIQQAIVSHDLGCCWGCRMSQFTTYLNNSTALLQSRLIRSALALAGYRMERQKDINHPTFDIWQHGRRKSQGFCTLSYTGWGKGIGKWWHLTGAIPQQVLNVISTCVGDEPIAQATSRGGSDL